MNLSLIPKGRKLMTRLCLTPLCEVLKLSEIENMDLSKVTCRAITNFCSEKQFWTADIITEIEKVVCDIGDDLDSILDVANSEDKKIIIDLRT